MKREHLALLSSYLINQQTVMRRLLAEAADVQADSPEKTSHLGYVLHNLYCALEDFFQEIAKTFENRVEDPSRYHRELLKRMSLGIPGFRPPLISPTTHTLLNELRGFRHVFRHAYDYELSPEKLNLLRDKMVAQWCLVDQDLEKFQNFLQEAISSLG